MRQTATTSPLSGVLSCSRSRLPNAAGTYPRSGRPHKAAILRTVDVTSSSLSQRRAVWEIGISDWIDWARFGNTASPMTGFPYLIHPGRNVTGRAGHTSAAWKHNVGISRTKLKFRADHGPDMIRLRNFPAPSGCATRSWLYGLHYGIPENPGSRGG